MPFGDPHIEKTAGKADAKVSRRLPLFIAAVRQTIRSSFSARRRTASEAASLQLREEGEEGTAGGETP
ncbi:hypothetical protein MASR2M17_04120 [Aminivibrio sp.]